MSAVSCPACTQGVKIPEDHEDLLHLCPRCGQCLHAPSFWSEGKKAGLPAPLAPPPRLSPVSSAMLVGGAALTALGLGLVFHLDWGEDGYFKIIAALATSLFAITFGGWWWEKSLRNLPQRSAATFVLPPDLPPEVVALGAPVAGYQSSSTFSALRFLLAGLLFAGMAAVAVAALLHERRDHEMAKLAMVAPLGAAGGIWIGLRGLLRRVRVLVCREGFLHVMGDRVAACPWDEIEAVYCWTRTYKGATYTICNVLTQDGRRFEFDGLKMNHVDQFGPVIEREACGRLLPRLVRAYDSGDAAAFGPLGVSREGLTHGSKTLPWDEVADVKPADGSLAVFRRNERASWCKIPLSNIPNVPVPLGLAGEKVHATR